MLRSAWVFLAAMLVVVTCWLLIADRLPLGVTREWQWARIDTPGSWPDLLLAALVAAGYVVFVRVGSSWLIGASQRRRCAVVLSLIPAALVVQMGLQLTGYGLAKWPIVLFFRGSSGYYTAARSEVRSTRDLLIRYGEIQHDWSLRYGPFHLATHPPGLVLLHYGAIRLCQQSPALTDALLAWQPAGVRDGFRIVASGSPLPRSDQASIWLVALLTQFASAVSVVPVYFLARRVSAAVPAWSVAALWPLVPAVVLFMPKSDVLYPLFAASSVALALAGRSAAGRFGFCAAAGLVLCTGMFFTFALVAIVPLVVLTVLSRGAGLQPAHVSKGTGWQAGDQFSGGDNVAVTPRVMSLGTLAEHLGPAARRLVALALGVIVPVAGLWLATGHNLPATWLRCYRIHASFYDRVPRSYWPWVGFNLGEFLVALGLPLAVAAIVGTVHLIRRNSQSAPAEISGTPDESGPTSLAAGTALGLTWWLTVIALDASGKNLGEVARLWIFLMPFAAIPAAKAMERSAQHAWTAAALAALLAIQTIVVIHELQGFLPPDDSHAAKVRQMQRLSSHELAVNSPLKKGTAPLRRCAIAAENVLVAKGLSPF
jgi:hypothetical protein